MSTLGTLPALYLMHPRLPEPHAGPATGTGTVAVSPGHGRESRGRLPARFFQGSGRPFSRTGSQVRTRLRIVASEEKPTPGGSFRNRGDPSLPCAGRRTAGAHVAPCQLRRKATLGVSFPHLPPDSNADACANGPSWPLMLGTVTGCTNCRSARVSGWLAEMPRL